MRTTLQPQSGPGVLQQLAEKTTDGLQVVALSTPDEDGLLFLVLSFLRGTTDREASRKDSSATLDLDSPVVANEVPSALGSLDWKRAFTSQAVYH
jgi:hypothetical protein